MNAENTKLLLTRYPVLYGMTNTVNPWDQNNPRPFHAIEGFGIECGDGWFDIIDKLSKQIEDLKVGAVAVQVKEKYGTLRFYLNGYNEKIDKFIRTAERKSAKTCEVCGKPGKLHTDGWCYVSCKEHEER